MFREIILYSNGIVQNPPDLDVLVNRFMVDVGYNLCFCFNLKNILNSLFEYVSIVLILIF